MGLNTGFSTIRNLIYKISRGPYVNGMKVKAVSVMKLLLMSAKENSIAIRNSQADNIRLANC